MGSIPVGTTPNASAWVFRVLAFFFADPADGSNPAMTLYNKNSNNFRFIHTEIGKNRCSEREKTGFGLNGTKKRRGQIPYPLFEALDCPKTKIKEMSAQKRRHQPFIFRFIETVEISNKKKKSQCAFYVSAPSILRG
ncbi:MAG: hypothetical protein OSJ35_04480 [Alistipes sp.]|nr:hypothetical protein [Alistipes sp.]